MTRPAQHLTRNHNKSRARALLVMPLLATPLAQAQECPASSRDAARHVAAPVKRERTDPLTQDVQVRSQGAEIGLREGSTYTLKGQVTIEQGDRTLTAEDAEYNPATGAFKVREGVQYQDPEFEVSGTGAQYDTQGGVTFDNAQFRLKNRGSRGAAQQIEINPEGELHLEDVRYTSCPLGKNDWLLTASDIDIDQQEGIGYGHNVRLDFQGVPILYVPFISFPVGNQRKSGFLFPTLGTTSRSGTELGVPWYWNIAPNYDATLLPTYYTRRGARLDTEFRYLTNVGRGTFDVDYLPSDQAHDHDDRSFVTWRNVSDFTQHLRLDIDGANASDTDWFEDFGSGPEGTSVNYVSRAATLTYLDDVWRITGFAQNFQTIDMSIARELRPYTIAPQLNVSATLPQRAYGLNLNFDGELTNFTRSDGMTGQRLDVAPQVSLPLQRPGYHLEPAMAWHYTTYQLDDQSAGTASSPSRTVPEFSVDAGMAFERLWGDKKTRLQTLEPRLRYLYVPYRDQDELPVFDTHPADLNLVQLFRSNRYVGLDRISDANQLSVGITSRLFDARDGRQYISGTVGQAVYFREPRTRLSGETLDNDSSDLIGELEVTAFKNWNVRLGVQWDSGKSRSEKGDVLLQYSPDNERVVNLGYRFRRKPQITFQQIDPERIEQVDGSFAWPISRSWSLYGRWVYSVEDDKAIDRFAGFEYRSCCWGVRFVSRRYLRNREGDFDNSFLIQLELNGLSNVGQQADAFLERSIRGYSPGSDQP